MLPGSSARLDTGFRSLAVRQAVAHGAAASPEKARANGSRERLGPSLGWTTPAAMLAVQRATVVYHHNDT
jgi:hypothetical protein